MNELNYDNHVEKINKLRINLYKKYSRNHLAFILNVSKTQVSRLLNFKSKMSMEQYFILLDKL